jgi:hypothetical protein
MAENEPRSRDSPKFPDLTENRLAEWMARLKSRLVRPNGISETVLLSLWILAVVPVATAITLVVTVLTLVAGARAAIRRGKGKCSSRPNVDTLADRISVRQNTWLRTTGKIDKREDLCGVANEVAAQPERIARYVPADEILIASDTWAVM